MAWSDETAALWAVEHGVRVLAWQQTEKGTNGRDWPRPNRPPQAVGETKAEQATTDRRAARYMERTSTRR
jgi:hypothetical protein